MESSSQVEKLFTQTYPGLDPGTYCNIIITCCNKRPRLLHFIKRGRLIQP